MTEYDVVVIGAGPAGLSAAITVSEYSAARILVIDEAERPGGRLPGQLYRNDDEWVIGADTAQSLVRAAQAAGVTLLNSRQVWSCEAVDTESSRGPQPAGATDSAQIAPDHEKRWRVHLEGPDVVTCHSLIIATGAAERPLPTPGWTLPGVFAVGAIQQLIQVQRILPGRRIAVIGTDALAMTAAEEIVLAGGEVTGIYLPNGGPGQFAEHTPAQVLTTLARFASLAPSAWQRVGARLMRSPLLAALAARVLPRSGIGVGSARLRLHRRVDTVLGDDRARAIRIAHLDGAGRPTGHVEIENVDAVCVSGGLYPLQELTSGLCELVTVEEVGGRVPLHSHELRTTAPGLFVAGNVTGIEGAAVAAAQGQLAGTTLAAELGTLPDSATVLATARSNVERARAEAPLTFLPSILTGRSRLSTLWSQHVEATSYARL